MEKSFDTETRRTPEEVRRVEHSILCVSFQVLRVTVLNGFFRALA
jgi:hypothetical protein